MTQANHEDHITLTKITAGAAVVAAVLFILDIGTIQESGTLRRMLEWIPVGVATAAYGSLALSASISLTNSQGLTGDEELRMKKGQNRRVLGSFWVMLVMAGFLILVSATEPAYTDGSEEKPDGTPGIQCEPQESPSEPAPQMRNDDSSDSSPETGGHGEAESSEPTAEPDEDDEAPVGPTP